jgi:hypothetical protein
MAMVSVRATFTVAATDIRIGLSVCLDTGRKIFGSCAPVELESLKANAYKADPSLKSFLFTLKNPRSIPAWRFALKAGKKSREIFVYSDYGPDICDISVSDNCNANTDSFTYGCGQSYTNDTGLDAITFFTGWLISQVKEIEVFQITE